MKVADNEAFLRFVEGGRVIEETMSRKFKHSIYITDEELMQREIKRVSARSGEVLEITLVGLES